MTHSFRHNGKLSTGYPQDDLEDLLDVPPFFDEDAPRGQLPPCPVRPPEASVDERYAPPAPSTPLQVRTKPGVVLPHSAYLRPALEIAQARGDVVTSGRDGRHLPNSLHYEGLAIDVRPAMDLAAQVYRYRSAGYSVLAEGLVDPATGRVTPITPGVGTGRHLHISFDPERRRV